MRDPANEVGTISECSFYLGWLTFLAKKRNFRLTNLKCCKSLHWCKFPDENTDILYSTQTEMTPVSLCQTMLARRPEQKFSITWDSSFLRLQFSNYWTRLSRIWRILQNKEGVIHRGRRPRWITPSEICRILHILRKPNSIIALLFIQNISSFLKKFRHFALCFSAHQI